MTVRCLMGQEPPEITDGYGGWEVITRPRRRAMTQWTGVQPLKMRLPIVLNRFKANESIEDAIQKLQQMASPGGPWDPPPVVDIDGAVPHARVGWVIESLEWGATERSLRHPHPRIRQEFVVNLLQHVPLVRVDDKGPQKNPNAYRIYTVKRGDTLAKIAAKLLKSRKRWREIARINGIRDPKSDRQLKPGRKLKVPKK